MAVETLDPQLAEGHSAVREGRALPEEGQTVGTALLPRPGERREEREGLGLERLAGLPVQLNVQVPLPDFRVADLLRLVPGSVVESDWPSSGDVPLSCGDVSMVWTEFEVVDQTLAVRVTRLA